VREEPGSIITEDGCVYRDSHCDMQPWAGLHTYCSASVNSALHPSRVAKASTGFGWGKGGDVTSAGWQVTLLSHMECELV